MDPAPGALVVMLLMVFGPGALLLRALHPRGSVLECLALAPPLSLALVFVVGEICTAAGLPFDPLRFGLALGIIGGAALLRRRGRAPEAPAPPDPAARTASRQAVALLVAGITLCGLTWFVGLRGVATTPPNRDSSNHGVMATQVARLETMDHARVLNSDVLGGAQKGAKDTAFYPLALHGEVALAHRLAGVTIADGLLAASLVFAALVLPLGLFLLTRTLVPENPIVAGLAPLLLAGTGCLPLAPMYFGGMALMAGIAMVPAVSVVATRYLIRGGSPATGLTVALAAVGIAATHTSEVPLLGIFCGALLAEAVWRGAGRAVAGAAIRRALGLGVACTVLMLPTLGALAGGTTERSTFDDSPIVSLPSALRGFADVVSFPNRADAVVLLAVAGLGLCLWQRRQLAMAFALISAAVLYVIAATLEGPLQVLTLPWYHHPARLAINAALLVPFFGAIAAAAAGAFVARLVRRDRPTGSFPVAIAAAMALVVGVAGLAKQSSTFHTMFQRLVPVDSDALAAFSYLGDNVQVGERVLNDLNNDGGMWMYAFEGVPPLFGFNPARPSASWNERSWLLGHLTELGTDPKVGALLEKYDVRFVYLNERYFDPRREHVLPVEAVRATPKICERLSRGTSHVFEIVPDGSCA